MATNRLRQFYNATRNCELASRVIMADNFFLRLKGLLGTSSLPSGHGLYLTPCASIHMFGMSYPIDAIFLDQHGRAIGLVENIAPGKMSAYIKGAKGCLELPTGTIASTGTAYGDEILQRECVALAES